MRLMQLKNDLRFNLLSWMFFVSTGLLASLAFFLPNAARADGPAASFDFSDLVEQAAPSVARVTVTKKINQQAEQIEQLPDIFQQFFGHQFQMPMPPREQFASGTAFFIAPEYLLTNYHVIADAKKVTVTLNDRREIDAEVIGSDPRTDIAVLKVKSGNFPVLKPGNAHLVKVGEPVLAIGSPFGFDYSATAGIISAKARALNRESTVPFIQSDVAMNPGSSGGPLFNRNGEVIGVNSRIFSGTGGYMGLSFSIPIDVAMDVYHQIRKDGKVTRAYFGVLPQDINRDLAELYKLDKPEGALINRIEMDSAAQKAGIKEGDIILKFNDQPILQASDLINLIARTKPGQAVSISIKRDGKVLTLGTVMQAAPDIESTKTLSNKISSKTALVERDSQKLGVQIRPLHEIERQNGAPVGVVIQSVAYGGLAEQTGLMPGDIVIKLNNHPTSTVSSFVAAVQSLPKNKVVAVHLNRRGVPLVLALRLS